MKTSKTPSHVSVASSSSGTALSDEDRRFLHDEFQRIHDRMYDLRKRFEAWSELDQEVAEPMLEGAEFAIFSSLRKIRLRFNIPYDWPKPPASAGDAPEGETKP